MDEEVRSHLRFLQSNPYAALQLPLPEDYGAGAGAGAFGVNRSISDSSGCTAVVTDSLVKSNYRRLALRFHPGEWKQRYSNFHVFTYCIGIFAFLLIKRHFHKDARKNSPLHLPTPACTLLVDKTGGTDSSPLFAAIRTAYETLATSRDRALHKPPHSVRPTVSPDGGEFYWVVQTVVVAATSSGRGVSDTAAAAATIEVAPRGSANLGGAWCAKVEQDDGHSIGRLVPQQKQASGTAKNNNAPKDVLSDSDQPNRCDGNAAADPEWPRARSVCEVEVSRQEHLLYGQGGGRRLHRMQQEKKRKPTGDDDKRNAEKQQHQLGNTSRDCFDVEKGQKRETRGVMFDRQDDGGAICCETGNNARNRSYSTSPQDTKRMEEEEQEEEHKDEEMHRRKNRDKEEEDRRRQKNRGMEEEETGRRKNRDIEHTWDSVQNQEGGGSLDGMVGRHVSVHIGKSSNVRQSPGPGPAAFFSTDEGGGSGFQQQQHQQHRYRNNGDRIGHQPNLPISGRRKGNDQLEEDSRNPGSHYQPSTMMTGAARANSDPLRPPSPPDEMSRTAPGFSSPVLIGTQPYPESECYRLQDKPQQLAAAVSCKVAERAPAANVAADASKETNSGGADAEGRNQAGEEGGRSQEEGALFLREPFQDDQGTEAVDGGDCVGSAGGVGVGGCVRRLRERVAPKGLDHHAACSSAVSHCLSDHDSHDSHRSHNFTCISLVVMSYRNNCLSSPPLSRRLGSSVTSV